MKLAGKTAIVTGAAQGIGRGIALALAREGADIVVCDIKHGSANKVVKEVRSMGRRAIVAKADVSKSGEVNEMVRKIIETFGKIDILVNNAGIITLSPVIELKEEEWDKVIDVNLKSVFLCSKAVATHMIERRSGKIINISSTSGKEGFIGQAHYCASKFGVIGLTQVLAKELAPYNINVNAVCPGIIYTDIWKYILKLQAEGNLPKGFLPEGAKSFEEIVSRLIPLGRPQTPEDIGNIVVFLASSDSGNITGQAINVCGGIILH